MSNEIIPKIILVALVGVFGIFVGMVFERSISEYHTLLIDSNHGEYNSKTGDFQLKEWPQCE